MIWMVQNLLHYTGDYMSKSESILTSKFYPEQNLNFLNKLLFVPYKDENSISLNFRLYIAKKYFPQFDGKSGHSDNFTKVLRYDLDAPYKAILVDTHNRIIVGDTREMNKYRIYPGYTYDSYKGFTEAEMPMTETWDEFNEEYNQEKIWTVHVQNQSYIGQPVYVEYFKDIITRESGESIIPAEYVSREHPEARYQFDKLNKPLRCSQKGYIIRADENGNEAEIVVMVEDPETNIRKYILGSEAYFYMKTDEPKKTIEELNIWQFVSNTP